MGKLTLDLSGQSVKLPKVLQDDEPTHVSRYWLIAQLLSSLNNKKDLKTLDVGGKEGLLPVFTGFDLTVLDIEPSDKPNFILGNALDMPFEDNEFEVVVSCDVLEHIDAKDRSKFVSEILRTSQRLAIICAPFNNSGVSEAEKKINSYYKSLLGAEHRWLQEHIDNGLPSESETEAAIKAQGFNYLKFRHFSLDIWIKVLKIHLLHAAFGDSSDVSRAAKKLYADYYNQLCSYDFSEEGYRTFFVVSKDELEVKLPTTSEMSSKKQKFAEEFPELLISTLQDQSAHLRQEMQKAGLLDLNLKQANQQLKQVIQELDAIKSTKGWRIYRKLAKAKQVVVLKK